MKTISWAVTRGAHVSSVGKNGPGISHGDIADHNARVVLELLRVSGPLTRRDLAGLTGLTEPAITGIVRRLEAAGLVASRRKPNADRYPSTEFMIRPESAVAVGLRLLPGRAEAVMIDLSGRPIDRIDLDGPAGLADAVRTLFARKPETARAIGVGLAAAPDFAIDVEALRVALAPLPVIVAPDTAAAVVAERLVGFGERDGGLVCLVLAEDGVRAGFSTGGRPFSGCHGLAGRIGGMRTGRDRTPLADRVSLDGLGPLIVAAAGTPASDPALARWAGEAASHLLDAAVVISGLIAPGIMVIGGDVPEAVAELVVADMRAERLDKASRPMASPRLPPVVASRLPGAGIAIGAALLPFLELLLPNPQAARGAAPQAAEAAAGD